MWRACQHWLRIVDFQTGRVSLPHLLTPDITTCLQSHLLTPGIRSCLRSLTPGIRTHLLEHGTTGQVNAQTFQSDCDQIRTTASAHPLSDYSLLYMMVGHCINQSKFVGKTKLLHNAAAGTACGRRYKARSKHAAGERLIIHPKLFP